MASDSGTKARSAQFQAFRNPISGGAGSQSKRRQNALDRQRQERNKSFSLHRDGLDSLADALELSDSEYEQDDGGELANKPEPAPSGNDANAMQTDPGPKPAGVSKTIKRKWKVYADRLMLGETLDYAEGLPPDFCEDWLAIGPIPAGKRCMAVSFNGVRMSRKGRMTNTLLLGRSSGRPLSRHLIPALPPDCVLDCIYTEDKATLLVLDVLQWKRQSMTESEAEFRMFWRDSKLAEIGPQPVPSTLPVAGPIGMSKHARTRTRPAQLVLVPVPSFPAPLMPAALLQQVIEPALRGEALTLAYHALAHGSVVTAQVQYTLDGIMFLMKSASYESGLTPLAIWIPKDELQQFGALLANLAASANHVA